MSQLHNDLRRRIAETLVRWVNDSASLYEMAGLEPYVAGADIISIMIQTVASSITEGGIPEEMVQKLLQSNIRANRAKAQ